jgi:formylglycine-generating enzyme required for sulfatase activity
MKYEISQEEYALFLNKLTRTQQDTRTATNLASGVTCITNRFAMTNTATMSNRNGICCGVADPNLPPIPTSEDGCAYLIHTSNPLDFYCDYNSNGTANESTDGQNIACNYLSWADISAYLDWAALRPMTELEYEKAARGTVTPVSSEYSWGNATSATSAYTLSNAGASNELIATNYSTTLGNVCYNSTVGGIGGPLRVGIFAAHASNTGRITAGASYYGIMELSGNLWERAVTVGNATGRAYTGAHGNGVLNASGDSDASNWPSTNAVGVGSRGSYWGGATAEHMSTSSRVDGANTLPARSADFGCRGVRLAP